jgi:hypothetical protein
MVSLVILLLLPVFMSTVNRYSKHMISPQPQLNSSTNSIVDNANLTQTLIEEAKDVLDLRLHTNIFAWLECICLMGHR